MIQLLDFTKKYSSKTACKDINLTAASGEITVLLGPNGAGKSTILKAVFADHYATSGRVLITLQDGRTIDAALNAEAVKGVSGFVGEVPEFYDSWTVAEFLNCAAATKAAASKPKAAASKPKAALDFAIKACSLGAVLNQKIATLSHGFKQRVSFAAALTGNPEILILDEPMTGLDPQQIFEMRALIKGLKNQRTIIFSTHIISEAASLADKIYIVSNGKIAAAGTVEELLSKSGKKDLEEAYLYFTGGER